MQQLPSPLFLFFLSRGFHMAPSQSPRLDFAGLLLSRQNDKSTPPQTDSVELDHHLHHTWNYSAWPCVWGEIGSKSTERHEITEMHVFVPSLPSTALHLQITFVPLTLDMCSKVSPSVKAHVRSRCRPLFFSSPCSPSLPLLALSLWISRGLYLSHFK